MAEQQAVQRLQFDDFPGRTLSVLLFKDVTNSKELREQVVSGGLVPECALANAALVPDLFVLQVAAHKALLLQSREALKTKSLHSELVFNLSGSRQISVSLERNGINATCQHVLAARFDATPAEEAAMQQLVAGSPWPLEDLGQLVDEQLLCKYLKVAKEELQVGSLADAVLLRIAARDC